MMKMISSMYAMLVIDIALVTSVLFVYIGGTRGLGATDCGDPKPNEPSNSLNTVVYSILIPRDFNYFV